MKKIFILLIRLYQLSLSPFLGTCCRFYPTCSEYAILAIKRFGATMGLFLSIKRILKCHPFHPGGYDPIPEEKNVKKIWFKAK